MEKPNFLWTFKAFSERTIREVGMPLPVTVELFDPVSHELAIAMEVSKGGHQTDMRWKCFFESKSPLLMSASQSYQVVLTFRGGECLIVFSPITERIKEAERRMRQAQAHLKAYTEGLKYPRQETSRKHLLAEALKTAMDEYLVLVLQTGASTPKESHQPPPHSHVSENNFAAKPFARQSRQSSRIRPFERAGGRNTPLSRVSHIIP